MILKDLLIEGLDVVFCGTAVGSQSAKVKAYYAGRGNKFYDILMKLNFTPLQILPGHYEELLKYKIGLTDLVKIQSGNDNVLSNDAFDIQDFNEKIVVFTPKIVCFNGKGAAAAFLYGNRKKTKKISYGLLEQKIGKTLLFVAPSTSGSARKDWDESFWAALKQMVPN